MLKIRQGQIDDLEILVQFQKDMASESEGLNLDPNVLKKGVQAALNDSHRGVYWIAELDSKPAGCLLVVPEWSDWRNGWVWWIHSVFVPVQFRRQGIYKALYENLRSLVNADPTLFGLRLYVEKDNHGAQKTYSAMGMDGEHYQLFQWMKHF